MNLKSFPILEGSIPQALTLNSEMNLKKFPIPWGVHSTTFRELRNEFKFFSNPGESIPQLLTLNSEMNLNIFQIIGGSIAQLLTLTSEMNLKNFPILWGPFHNFSPWTQKWKFCIDIFYRVSYHIKCITDISNLHFSIAKNGKLTFSNGSQLMEKKFIAHLHASLDSTCKSRISKISTRCQKWGSIPKLLILNSEMNLKIFLIFGCPFHNFWPWT